MLDDDEMASHDDSEDEAIEFVDLSPDGLDKRAQRVLAVQAVGTRLWTTLRRPRLFSLPTVLTCLLLVTLLSGSQLYRQIARPVVQHKTQYASIIIMQASSLQGPFIWSTNGTGTGTRFIVEPGPLPQGCPMGVAIGNLQTVGDYPVWIKGFVGPNAHLPLLPTDAAASPWMGWDVPLQVSMISGFPAAPTLSFSSLTSGFPPFFTDGGGTTYSTIKTLDLNEATQSTPYPGKHMDTWKLTVHVMNSGCYKLDVDWSGGHWFIEFTAQ